MAADSGRCAFEALSLGAGHDIDDAMHVAHEKGIVHRDLKPENVILNERGEPKITDFGLCLVLDDSRSRVTCDGAALGTWLYMAPEVLSGNTLDHSHLIDIYSLGVMLFEFLVGKPPYVGGYEVLRHRIENHSVPRLSESQLDIDGRLDDICAAALAKSPSERLPSMEEFARRLREVQNSPPVIVPRVSDEGTVDQSGGPQASLKAPRA